VGVTPSGPVNENRGVRARVPAAGKVLEGDDQPSLSALYYDVRARNCIGLTRYIAITNLSITAVFVEYLRQFLIDLHQIYRHSSVPRNTSP